MTNPITPPPELVRQWMERTEDDEHTWLCESYIAEQAAQWGADQELEACVNWLDREGWSGESRHLRISRRPKPPTLKEQALGAIGRFTSNAHTRADEMAQDFDTIRRALEALPND